MKLADGLGHLTYSTLVHAGDTWEQMWASLQAYVPQVKARVSPDAPFGLCLRLSAVSAETLAASAAERAALTRFLAEHDLYVFTVNAFVYGGFKDQLVKEEVYEPDWRTEERVRYTMNVADVLAEIAPADVQPSIQTPPMGFKPKVTGPEVIAKYRRNVLRVAAHLIELERRTGTTVTLAIEPEPACFVETADEAIEYFRDHLYSGETATELAELTGLPIAEAHAALRRHIGLVYDVGHQAVEFEDPRPALLKLVAAGIPVFKLQLAAALRIPDVGPEDVERLRRFAGTIYLTQTVQRRGGEITRFLNMEDAFAAWESDPGGTPREWRIHFHVPIFLERLGELETTRASTADALALHREQPLSRHVEIETYTFDVLPDEFKTGDIVEYVSREIEWATAELAAKVVA
jgi:sugar phosphate isomerase/epimerase